MSDVHPFSHSLTDTLTCSRKARARKRRIPIHETCAAIVPRKAWISGPVRPTREAPVTYRNRLDHGWVTERSRQNGCVSSDETFVNVSSSDLCLEFVPQRFRADQFTT